MRDLLGLSLAIFAAGCGGADATSLFDDGGVTTTDGSTTDVVIGPDVQLDSPPPPTVCTSDGGGCTDPNVPQGWTPVALTTTNTTSPCPADFGTGVTLLEDPTPATNACTCSCTKTQDPDCQTGSSIWSGIGLTCSSGAASLSYSGGKCRPTSGTVDDYDKATTIAPTGGTCQVQKVVNAGAVTSTPAKLCQPDSSCAAAVCGGYAPAGFSACIVTDGDVPCPTGSVFANKHTVAQQAQAQCTDCTPGCSFQGSCTNPKLSFYSDQQCQTLIVSIPADGTCDATGHNGAVVAGTTYTATASFTGCTATGSSTASLNLNNARTVCCRP